MITTKYVRDNIDDIRDTLKKRGSDYPIDELLKLDEEWRSMKTSLQELQAERNRESIKISELKKKGKDAKKMVSQLGELKARVEKGEKELDAKASRIEELLWNMPNTLDRSVPAGQPPEANKVMREWGVPKKANIGTHEEILVKAGLLDVERAAKTAGARFYFLKGDMVLLEQALLRYALDFLASRGYIPILPPFMLKRKYYRGAAPIATFEDALYSVGESREAAANRGIEHVGDELYMIATAEHALAAMHAEELFSGNRLPLKYAGVSPCFRREAGAHGKDTKGIFRVHQFDKVEQFVFCKEEDEQKYFDELLSNTEQMVQALGIPYRLVLLCSGDTGHQMRKSVDLEGWFPGQKDYRELMTCSSAGVWQSMRLDIKYDHKAERKYVCTLNNTGISAERMLVCITENYANDDGTITVPKALVPYMGKDRIGE
ncbi:serine--tRNA ligase [Candidatus Marsarchaeota archaeon]|jgi:seryl-tRNA synthetase|nr:serine--tRNA ligase [Candidatus Marsarchaeota archaeon]